MFILGVYILGSVIIFVYFCRKETKFTNTGQYLLADHSSTWPVIAAALFSAGTSSEHFVGLATETQTHGIRIIIFELQAALQLMLLGYVVGPTFFQMKLVTTSEFFEHRFNSTCRMIYAIWTLLLYVVVKYGVTIYAVAIIYQTLFQLPHYVTAILILLIPCAYAVWAGARAIFISEIWHTVFILLGAGIFIVYLSGFDPTADFRPPDGSPPNDDQRLPLPALLLGTPVMVSWAWNFDQVSAQCIFSAVSVQDIQRGCTLAAGCRLVCAILLMLPSCFHRELTYEQLIQIQPLWVQGAIVAAITAAAISSLAGIFNATTTIFIYDIYKKVHPTASEQQLITTARLMNLFLGIVSIVLLPVVSIWGTDLYTYITEILSHIIPCFVGCFVFGLYYPTGSEACAKWIMIIFPILGLVRWIFYKLHQGTIPANDHLVLQWVWSHELYFSLFMCLLTLVVLQINKDPSTTNTTSFPKEQCPPKNVTSHQEEYYQPTITTLHQEEYYQPTIVTPRQKEIVESLVKKLSNNKKN